MANRVIFTDVFRVSFVHLAERYKAEGSDQEAKFDVSMMFPKSGVCPINQQPTGYQSIVDALNECTMEVWGLDYTTAIQPGMGVQFPPNFKDGDTVFQKDSNKNPIPGKISPESAGMWILSVKNIDTVGTVDPSGKVDIAPSAIYSGSWAKARIEATAYEGKKGRVVALKLIDVQLCYNDTPFGNKPVYEAATTAFASMAVTDTNIKAGAGQDGAFVAAGDPVVMNAGENPYAEQIAAGWTDALLIQHGKATTKPVPLPAAPPPGAATAAPPPGAATAAPPLVVNNDPVVMNPGEDSYAAQIAAGWTDALLIEQGKGVPNYNT